MKKLSQFATITLGMVVFGFVLIEIILAGYSIPGTGFGDYTKPNSEFVRGKTLWDWVQLFIIPIVGSIGVFLLNQAERAGERQRAEERAKLENDLATGRQQEAALQAYLDRMANLLLEKKLRTSELEETRDVARIQTLTVLRGLDANRKGFILLFLYEAQLIDREKPIIDLSEADLKQAHLASATLKNAQLSSADLSGADLTFADLREANLQGADLRGAKLKGAKLEGADLTRANLNLANLEGAVVSNEQLAVTYSLRGTIMRDGTIHE